MPAASMSVEPVREAPVVIEAFACACTPPHGRTKAKARNSARSMDSADMGVATEKTMSAAGHGKRSKNGVAAANMKSAAQVDRTGINLARCYGNTDTLHALRRLGLCTLGIKSSSEHNRFTHNSCGTWRKSTGPHAVRTSCARASNMSKAASTASSALWSLAT